MANPMQAAMGATRATRVMAIGETAIALTLILGIFTDLTTVAGAVLPSAMHPWFGWRVETKG